MLHPSSSWESTGLVIDGINKACWFSWRDEFMMIVSSFFPFCRFDGGKYLRMTCFFQNFKLNTILARFDFLVWTNLQHLYLVFSSFEQWFQLNLSWREAKTLFWYVRYYSFIVVLLLKNCFKNIPWKSMHLFSFWFLIL